MDGYSSNNEKGRCEESYQTGPLNPASFGSQRGTQNQEKDDENNRGIHQAMSEKLVRLFQLLFSERVSQLNDLLIGVMWWLWIVHFPRQMSLIEQVIMQVLISTHFGVLSEQLPVAGEHLLFIKATFTPAPAPCKAHSTAPVAISRKRA
jgi:hypothetical protein